MRKLTLLCSSTFLLLAIFSCTAKEDELIKRTQFIMGTLVDSLDGVESMILTDSGPPLFSENFESQPGFVLHDYK